MNCYNIDSLTCYVYAVVVWRWFVCLGCLGFVPGVVWVIWLLVLVRLRFLDLVLRWWRVGFLVCVLIVIGFMLVLWFWRLFWSLLRRMDFAVFLWLCIDLLWLWWFCLAVGMAVCGLGDFLVFWVGV